MRPGNGWGGKTFMRHMPQGCQFAGFQDQFGGVSKGAKRPVQALLTRQQTENAQRTAFPLYIRVGDFNNAVGVLVRKPAQPIELQAVKADHVVVNDGKRVDARLVWAIYLNED